MMLTTDTTEVTVVTKTNIIARFINRSCECCVTVSPFVPKFLCHEHPKSIAQTATLT
jgi:hypothetical protein